MILWSAAVEKRYSAPIWMTYKQAAALKANVRKGEHGSPVVYADRLIRTSTDEVSGEAQEYAVPFLKAYTVFNVEQIEGLPPHFHAPAAPRLDPVQRIAHADAFFAASKAVIRHGGGMAAYHLAQDVINMPPFECFRDAEGYYATLAHECTHWTRHPSRLDRDLGRKRFGDAGYAAEELVAELGAAFLCADIDLRPSMPDEHASYIASWIEVLQNDSRAIFAAAAHAQRAVDFLHALQVPQLCQS